MPFSRSGYIDRGPPNLKLSVIGVRLESQTRITFVREVIQCGGDLPSTCGERSGTPGTSHVSTIWRCSYHSKWPTEKSLSALVTFGS